MSFNPGMGKKWNIGWTYVASGFFVAAVILIAYPGFYFPWAVLSGGDCVTFHYPFLETMRRGISEYSIPLWFNGVYAGGYGLAEIGLGFAYPFHQLLHVFSTVSVIKLEFIFHSLLLFLGMRSWLRLWIDGERVVYITALLAVLSFQHHATLFWGHVEIHASMCYFPWVLYFIHRLALAEQRRDVVGFTALLSLACGMLWYTCHPQLIMQFTAAGFLYFLFLQKRAGKGWIHSGKMLFVLAIILGIGVGLVQFYGTFSVLAGSGRQVTQSDAQFLMSGSLHPLHLIKWISPYLFGIQGSYWGQHEFWMGQLFSGPLLLLLFLLGWKRLSLFFKVLIVVCLLLSFGRYTPLYDIYNFIVPGASLFRYSSRFLYVLLPFIFLSLGYGMERVVREKIHPLWLALPLLAIFLFISTSHALKLVEAFFPVHVVERWNNCQTPWYILPVHLLEMALVVAFVWAPRQWRRIMIIACILPVLLHHWAASSFAQVRFPRLEGNPSSAKESAVPQRIMIRDFGSTHNFPLYLGIHSLVGYSAIVPYDYRSFLDTLCAQEWQKQNRVQVYGLSDAQMEWLNIDREYEGLDSGYQPVELVKSFPNRRDRYFLTDSFMDIEMRADSPFSSIIRNKQEELAGQFFQEFALELGATPVRGSVKVLKYGNEEVVLSVELSAPGILASSENTAPIWTAQVDGAPSQIHNWMGCFRSVFLDKGHHEVRFFIDRQGFYFRCVFSCLLAFLLFCCALPMFFSRLGSRCKL